MMNDDECGAVGGMSDMGNPCTRRKPDPVPLCPPHIPHDLTWNQTRIFAMGSCKDSSLTADELEPVSCTLTAVGIMDVAIFIFRGGSHERCLRNLPLGFLKLFLLITRTFESSGLEGNYRKKKIIVAIGV
jgi:hypothetical protein